MDDSTVAARLFERIKHGDEKHQAWLRAELDAFFASPAAPAVQTGEAACGCGHILAQHDVGYSTPYQCRAGAVCLCGRFKAAVEPTAGTP